MHKGDRTTRRRLLGGGAVTLAALASSGGAAFAQSADALPKNRAGEAKALAREKTLADARADKVVDNLLGNAGSDPAITRAIGDPVFDLAGDGKAKAPRRDVKAELAKQANTNAAVEGLPIDFVRDGYTWNELPIAWRHYTFGEVFPKVDPAPHDQTGVRMYPVDGVLYDHPTGQAQLGLKDLESYRLTKDVFHLERARKQAQRLFDTKVESNGGWYYPFGFDFDMHQKNKWWIRAPWYSGMAQGQVLSFLVMMSEIDTENSTKWREGADFTFKSFWNTPKADTPWVVHGDDTKHIWFEEYAHLPVEASDWTFNGHVFAVWGLWDYYRITKNPDALALYDGGITTINYYYSRAQRYPAYSSYYCVTHKVPSAKYHRIHIEQYVYLWLMTKEQKFVKYADTLREDYPYPYVVPDRRVDLAKRTHTAYKFNLKTGAIQSTKTLALTAASATTSDLRQRILGRGIYYHVTSGALKDYWIAESVTRGVRMWGAAGAVRYFKLRKAGFKGNTPYTGYKYDSAGKLLTKKTTSFSQDSSAGLDMTAWILGGRYARMASGTFAGYWVPTTGLTIE